MSDTESFIDEVSEEVRRERLFGLMKRYGWIAAVLIVVLVGGAAFNEYRKASQAAKAQELGDAILSAMNSGDAGERIAALDSIEPSGENQVLVRFLAAADKSQNDQNAAVIADYTAITTDETVDPLYRDLAQIKSLALQVDTLDAATRRTAYDTLATPGSAFRLMAEEQLALLDIEEGKTDEAVTRLRAIIADGEVTTGLRRRASQLIVASGASLDES